MEGSCPAVAQVGDKKGGPYKRTPTHAKEALKHVKRKSIGLFCIFCLPVCLCHCPQIVIGKGKHVGGDGAEHDKHSRNYDKMGGPGLEVAREGVKLPNPNITVKKYGGGKNCGESDERRTLRPPKARPRYQRTCPYYGVSVVVVSLSHHNPNWLYYIIPSNSGKEKHEGSDGGQEEAQAPTISIIILLLHAPTSHPHPHVHAHVFRLWVLRRHRSS
jgi:hypothetical protein